MGEYNERVITKQLPRELVSSVYELVLSFLSIQGTGFPTNFAI